jgi:hypothetical protein
MEARLAAAGYPQWTLDGSNHKQRKGSKSEDFNVTEI